MATLHVRNVPERLYERLRQRAEQENRSLSAEVIMLLDRALEESREAPAELLAQIRRRRSYHPADAGAPDSTSLLRQDRDR
jgi:plasmid stability protein